jgi:hypothetical protein
LVFLVPLGNLWEKGGLALLPHSADQSLTFDEAFYSLALPLSWASLLAIQRNTGVTLQENHDVCK